jgi:hypothetical protein
MPEEEIDTVEAALKAILHEGAANRILFAGPS